MRKEDTFNEKEQRDAIYTYLTEKKGIDVTKTLIDQVMDAQNDLTAGAFVQGKGLKFSGLGTLKIVELKERNYKVPDGKGGWITGTSPAHKTVHFEASDVLLEKMNNPLG